jgi:nucleotide-binding universal stress UspA family protein
MSGPRRFLVALAGTEDPALAGRVAEIVSGDGGPAAPMELTLLHVVETGPRELAAFGPAARRGPWPSPPRAAIESSLAGADQEGSAALLAVWQERFAAALPGATIANAVAQGRPEQEIVAAVRRLSPDAVVLCARPRTGPTEPGPRSVGHVARFVTDHSPVPVLLIRHEAP